MAVAAIVNRNNEVLISKRHDDAHQGGLWEFPGGKVEAGENVEAALVRELKEELDIELKSFRPLIKVHHHYADKDVLLDVWRVDDYEGNPAGLEGQPVCWQPVTRLSDLNFPAANAPIIQALNLPSIYLITGHFDNELDFEKRMMRAIERGIKLVQLRLTYEWYKKNDIQFCRSIIDKTLRLTETFQLKLMLNLPDELLPVVSEISGRSQLDYGMHLNSKKLRGEDVKLAGRLLSASCHDMDELELARRLNVDFVVISPVLPTASHPDIEPLGWSRFATLTENLTMPAYALGGVTINDLERSWSAGGQGVAAISSLWNDRVIQ